MVDYYLDIETTGTDVENDKILTIQFQKLDVASGKKEGELKILKIWESSEEEILKEFYDIFDPLGHLFSFNPIGVSLYFDYFMLHTRWNKFGIDVPLKRLIHEIPHVDIKPILTIFNGGKHKGASLDNFTGKKNDSSVIPELYNNKDFSRIEEYIVEETEGFIKFYQMIKEKIPDVIIQDQEH